MEERKQNPQSEMMTQDQKYKARINNNASYMRAQASTFQNLSQIDRQLAYSLNSQCHSLASVRQQQLLSLITKFRQPNVENKDGKQVFKNIIRNRFQQEVPDDNERDQAEYEINSEEEFEDEDYDDEESSDHSEQLRQVAEENERQIAREEGSNEEEDGNQSEESL